MLVMMACNAVSLAQCCYKDAWAGAKGGPGQKEGRQRCCRPIYMGAGPASGPSCALDTPEQTQKRQ